MFEKEKPAVERQGLTKTIMQSLVGPLADSIDSSGPAQLLRCIPRLPHGETSGASADCGSMCLVADHQLHGIAINRELLM